MRSVTLMLATVASLAAAESAAAQQVDVIFAHYGFNCGANGIDYDTDNLRQHCKGKAVCYYTINAGKIGDPYPGCMKAYNVEYACGGTGKKAVNVPGEASGAAITLSCQ